jgi:hypothetical protein
LTLFFQFSDRERLLSERTNRDKREFMLIAYTYERQNEKEMKLLHDLSFAS